MARGLRRRAPPRRPRPRLELGRPRRIAIDARGDLHARGSAYLDYLRVIRMAEGWREHLDRQDIALAILPGSEPAARALVERHGWRRLFDDGRFTVIARPEDQSRKPR